VLLLAKPCRRTDPAKMIRAALAVDEKQGPSAQRCRSQSLSPCGAAFPG
jgi:hypothetical protein